MNRGKNRGKIIKVFIIEDDEIFAKTVQIFLRNTMKSELDIYRFTSGSECLESIHLNPNLVIVDLNLPDMPGLQLLSKLRTHDEALKIIVLSGQRDVKITIDVFKQGVDYYILKSANCWDELKNAIAKVGAHIQLQLEVESLKDTIVNRNRYSNILGNSPEILKILKVMQKVEKSSITVLITGESGTGKELIAQTLHYNSPRKKKNFIPINVPAIPQDLIESELFGHEKGAFTGASRKRIGKFEDADGGTLFLDEIGEMSLDLQSKLLRVLQEKEVVRVGSNKTISMDVRIVASTNKDLMMEVREGRFREDLYYRLSGFFINLPPLRERGNDITLLAKYFLNLFCKENKLPDIFLGKEAIAALAQHRWPGNIRELKSIIDRSALLCESLQINRADLVFDTSEPGPRHVKLSA
ncbi:MAG: sigma-54-dependent Fis family transcriptional regulator [Flavobacteriales bacterium]|nr:sigma-54-dependent Fis family transcriptional regulator [Flavobacteriales bacterium]